jgi:two-component system chemotaxis response regulator CheY
MSRNKKLGVLIVDDNDVSRSMLRHILASEEDYRIVGVAGNGSLALQMAERLSPDIVCLDIVMMNGPDGLDVLAQIKKRWPQMIVLMVTGSKDAQTFKTATEHGADGYIVKPFNPGTLLEAVERAVAKVRG